MTKLNFVLAEFYERDLLKLIDEVNSFKHEEHLWNTDGSVKNSCGNLAMHIIGGLNHFIGATLAHSGYVRNRDGEFSRKGVGRAELIRQLEALIPLINQTISALSPEEMEAEFPIYFDKPKTSIGYVLTQLLLHLNYHLGQVNYLRRIVD